MVYYPTVASSGIARIYLATGKNQLYAQQGRPSANDYAQLAETLFERDQRLTQYYNDTLTNGKWKNMMSDIHIGYTNWSMPEKAVLPEQKQVTPLENPDLGISVEGSEATEKTGKLELPVFDALLGQSYYIDLFNRGTGSFDFTATPSEPWIKINQKEGTVTDEERLWVSIDWKALPAGTHEASLTIQSGNTNVPVLLRAVNGEAPPNR